MIGIHPPELNQQKYLINWKNTIFMSFSVQMLCSIVAFLFLEAESMFEYAFSFFLLVCLINDIINFSTLIWKSENTFKFFSNCEEFIEKRE